MERAYQTCIEIFTQRGYEITSQDEEQISAIKQNGEEIYAFLSEIPKFNTDRAQEYIGLMYELGIKHSLLVYKNSITSAAKKIEQNLPDMKIELFSLEELQYNITKHRLQPKFECLPKKEADDFKKKYGTRFAIMLKSDPISRFYGYQPGNVIKVTRKNGYVTFRIVR